MSKHAKGMPILDPPLHDILRMALFEIKGDSVAFDATSPVTLFTIPANTWIDSVIINVTTAFDNPCSLELGDGTTASLFGELKGSLRGTGWYKIKVGRNLTAAISLKGTITSTPLGYPGAGAVAAGAFTPYLIYRPNSSEQAWVNK